MTFRPSASYNMSVSYTRINEHFYHYRYDCLDQSDTILTFSRSAWLRNFIFFFFFLTDASDAHVLNSYHTLLRVSFRCVGSNWLPHLLYMAKLAVFKGLTPLSNQTGLCSTSTVILSGLSPSLSRWSFIFLA